MPPSLGEMAQETRNLYTAVPPIFTRTFSTFTSIQKQNLHFGNFQLLSVVNTCSSNLQLPQ